MKLQSSFGSTLKYRRRPGVSVKSAFHPVIMKDYSFTLLVKMKNSTGGGGWGLNGHFLSGYNNHGRGDTRNTSNENKI